MDLESIFERLNRHLSEDSKSIFSQSNKESDKSKTGPNGGAKRRFANYLVSVATHPIALGASIWPFNASVESMLAYLMDMFRISETQLKKMLIVDHLEDFKNVKSPATFKKRHSWRPELRVRICPPVFYQTKDSRNPLDNLSVRVYIFKSDQKTSLSTLMKETHSDSASRGKETFLDILSQSRVNPAILIRPTSEMFCELRFAREANSEVYRAIVSKNFKGSNRNPNKEDKSPKSTEDAQENELASDQVGDDFCLNIRRTHCEPKSPYVLRLEFWLESSATRGLGYLRRLARYIVHNNAFGSCTKSKQSATVYSTTDTKSLYGFTNVRMSHIPSYAARTSHPIFNMREAQINTCELITEIRNRRLNTADAKNDKSLEFIINHARLYAACVSHQLSLIIASPLVSAANVTLDNILYLPAFAIINQHRLQANLSVIEDQSLRRSALLSLLRQFSGFSPNTSKSTNVSSIDKMLLVSMIEHEYLVAHRLFDGKTMQEVDPFNRDLVVDNSRAVIIDIESKAIQCLADECLKIDRLKSWVSRASRTSDTNESCTMFLPYLGLVRLICEHNQNNHLVHVNLSSQATTLYRQTNKLLSSSVTEELARRLTELMKTRRHNQWWEMLNEVQAIDNDLILHWNGLDGLDIHVGDDATRKAMRSMIENKVSRYLAN